MLISSRDGGDYLVSRRQVAKLSMPLLTVGHFRPAEKRITAAAPRTSAVPERSPNLLPAGAARGLRHHRVFRAPVVRSTPRSRLSGWHE
jgi:hypothetical protein